MLLSEAKDLISYYSRKEDQWQVKFPPAAHRMKAEVRTLDLKNNKITLGELLDHPNTRAVLQKRFPMALKQPLMGAARTVTLEQALAFAQAYVPPKKLNEALNDLRRA